MQFLAALLPRWVRTLENPSPEVPTASQCDLNYNLRLGSACDQGGEMGWWPSKWLLRSTAPCRQGHTSPKPSPLPGSPHASPRPPLWAGRPRTSRPRPQRVALAVTGTRARRPHAGVPPTPSPLAVTGTLLGVPSSRLQVSWECSKFSFSVISLTFTFPPSAVAFVTGSPFNYSQCTFGGEGAGFINNLCHHHAG